MNGLHVEVASREAGQVDDDAEVVDDFFFALLAALLKHVNNVAHELVDVLFLRIVIAHFDEGDGSAFEIFLIQYDALFCLDLLPHKLVSFGADVLDVEFFAPFCVLTSRKANFCTQSQEHLQQKPEITFTMAS